MSRKELIKVADRLTEQIEAANLTNQFSTELAKAVHEYEWLVHFEGRPVEPTAAPENGGEAHARLMDSLAYVLSGELASE